MRASLDPLVRAGKQGRGLRQPEHLDALTSMTNFFRWQYLQVRQVRALEHTTGIDADQTISRVR